MRRLVSAGGPGYNCCLTFITKWKGVPYTWASTETCWQAIVALLTPTPRFVVIFFFFFFELVCSSARGHLILKTRLGKSNLISKGVSTGVEETGRVPWCGPEFSTPCDALNLQLLWWKERAMAEMNVRGIFTGLICVHKWVGELSKLNCYFGLLLGYSYSTGNMFRKCFH